MSDFEKWWNKIFKEIADEVSSLMNQWYSFYNAFKKVANWHNKSRFTLSNNEFKVYIKEVWSILWQRKSSKASNTLEWTKEELAKILEEERKEEILKWAHNHEKYHSSIHSDF